MDCLVGCRFDGREFPGYGSLPRISRGCFFFFFREGNWALTNRALKLGGWTRCCQMLHVWNIYLHEWPEMFTINLGKYSLHEAYGELDLASLLFARSCQLQPEHPMASRLDPDIGNKQLSGFQSPKHRLSWPRHVSIHTWPNYLWNAVELFFGYTLILLWSNPFSDSISGLKKKLINYPSYQRAYKSEPIEAGKMEYAFEVSCRKAMTLLCDSFGDQDTTTRAQTQLLLAPIHNFLALPIFCLESHFDSFSTSAGQGIHRVYWCVPFFDWGLCDLWSFGVTPVIGRVP